MRALLLTITLVAFSATASATIYRWVDEQGVTHYSDQPHTGAEKVHVEAPQVYSAPAVKATGVPSSLPVQAQASGSQITCEIDSPSNDQMFMNAHSVSGHVQLSYNAGPGLRVSVLLDGKPVAVDASGGFTMDDIERGTHTLSATVTDPNGQTVCQSQSIMFHVHQPSQQAPNAVNRPKF